MNKEIEAKLRKIIAENVKTKVPVSEIGEDIPLEDYGISSMNFIKIIVGVESEFGFMFEDEELEFNNFRTLKDAVHFIEKKVTAA